MYESGEKRDTKPNQMKDSDRLREAKKQVMIVDNDHDGDVESLAVIYQHLLSAIKEVEDRE